MTITEKISQSYNKAYEESDHLHDSDNLYRWVLTKLKVASRKKILDIACGVGLINKHAETMGLDGFGIDISSIALQKAKTRAGRSGFCVADGEILPFNETAFDYVTNVGSLEHFPNIETGFSEMNRVLRQDGTAAILLPNSYYLIDIIWKVWRTGYPISHRQLIERFATYNQWKDLIEKNHFRVIKGYKYNFLFPTSIADIKYYFRKPKMFILMLAGWLIPKNLSYHFLFICKKK